MNRSSYFRSVGDYHEIKKKKNCTTFILMAAHPINPKSVFWIMLMAIMVSSRLILKIFGAFFRF